MTNLKPILNEDIYSLHKYLLEYRILNNLKQKEMAQLLKCTQSQYSLWETGVVKPSPLREKEIYGIIK